MISYFKLLFLFVHLLKFPLKVELNSKQIFPKQLSEKQKQEFWENAGKRRNFIFYGVDQPKNETKEQLRKHVMSILNNRMQVDVAEQEIDDIQRLGHVCGHRRPVRVNCTTEWRRNSVMKRDYTLKGTTIFIEPDMKQEELAGRMRNMQRMHELRAKGIHAYVMKGRLMVNGRVVTEPTTAMTSITGDYEFLGGNYKSDCELEMKRRNFVMYGVPRLANETFQDLSKTVLHILNDQMKCNVSILEIDNIWRLGKTTKPGKCRPTLVKMLSEWRKKEIMSCKNLLKGTHIFMSHDLPKERIVGRRVSYQSTSPANNTSTSTDNSSSTTDKWAFITAETAAQFYKTSVDWSSAYAIHGER